MNIVLETKGVSKNFGAVSAAADLNVRIAKQEIIGVIGANGAGKTTFINMVTGHLKPSSGSIHYQNQDITALVPRELTRIGLRRSFQIPQLFPQLTVLDNMLIALGADNPEGIGFWKPLASAQKLEEADSMLEQFQLNPYRDQLISALPQGIRKLLDIALATVGETSVLMLDEPTSGVSVDEKFGIMDMLIEVLKKRGITVLFVEHDMEIVERYALRVLAFYDGKIIADGPTAEALADAEVRQYVIGAELHRNDTETREPYKE